MDPVSFGAGVVAGCVITAGGIALWHYKEKISELLTDLMKWVNSKIKSLAKYAQEIFRAVAETTRLLVLSAYQSLSNRWNSTSPENRRRIIEAAGCVVNAGINAAIGNAENQIRIRFPNSEAPERHVLEDMASEMRRFQTEHGQSMTRYLI